MNTRTLLILLFLKTNGLAQTDSAALLPPALLDDSLILKYKPPGRENIFTTASRGPERPEGLPFSTFVITSEEILRNGYVTLADALKAAPGIRVSQPGSAVEGEKFLMNGLAGNRYVKILINDVPIKPSVQLGMPIAEQLPIRQADRIEVFYGPSAVMFGSDACAGVVNIILKQSERPVFTQADLSFGRFGYNNLDLMFGGKVGKDKKIFRFSLFGSSTVRESTNIDFSEVEMTDNYLLFNENDRIFSQNPNYRKRLDTKDNRPVIGQLNQDSRMFGFQMKWRGIDFMYLRTARFIHSAIGQNTLAYSYSNPSNILAEKSEVYSATFRTGRRRFKTQNILSLINYKLENFSTAALVYDATVAALGHFFPGDSADWKKRHDFNFKKYLSDDRFLFSNGFDVRHELRTSFLLGKKSSLDAGWQANLGGGNPLLNRSKMPVFIGLLEDGRNLPAPQPFSAFADGDIDANIFAQFNRRGKRLTLNFAASTNLSFIYGHDPLLNFRAGGLYKISSEWAVLANFSTGFRRPPIFYQSQSYIYERDSIRLASYHLNDATERFYYNELGIRYSSNSKNQIDLVFFRQRADYLMRNGYLIDSTRSEYYKENYYGHANAPGEAMKMWGIRLSATSKTLDMTGDINHRPTKFFWRNEFFLQYARGEEFFGYGYQPLKTVANQPRLMLQFRTAMRVGKSELVTSFNRQSASASSAAFFTQYIPRQAAPKDIEGFTTWDFTYRFHMSKHFLFYLHLTNAFNRKYGGLDATGGPDDLVFNPQQLRQARFGANYNLN